MNRSQDREQIQQLKEECIRISEEKIKVSKQFEKLIQKSLLIIQKQTKDYQAKHGLLDQQNHMYALQNNLQQYGSQENEKYCVCQKIANDTPMIKCDSKTCKIQWYHFSCLGLSKQEVEANDQWFCPYCKGN